MTDRREVHLSAAQPQLRTVSGMRQVLVLALFGVFGMSACASSDTAPLTLDDAAAAGSRAEQGGVALVTDSTSPIERPVSPPTSMVDTPGEPGAPSVQLPGNVVPSDPMLPGVATPPVIGDYCNDHLDPARLLLEDAERTGSITPTDRAIVQETLDTALEHCTPGEYFAFQQELFAFVDPTAASTVAPQPGDGVVAD